MRVTTRRARTAWTYLLLAGLLGLLGLPPAGGVRRATADEPPEGEERPFARAPDPATSPGPDADLFTSACELQARGKYVAARRRFWKLVDEYPASPYAAEAEDRSGANAYLGVRAMGETGPSEHRIDVALMGDGYLLAKQSTYDKHCEGQLAVLLGEQLYAEYRPYFNFWQFNLASEDKGVDEPTPPEPDEELAERRRRRGHKPRAGRQYNTALDCKAAGPQGQVWANPRRVWHYLQYLDVNDGLAIVFAQMGRLGMGGMGIATTGPRGVVVHEFGHAFIGLLDEYANNPGEPQGFVSGANATTTPEHPPWQHFLDAKVPGVGVYEGGATFQKGVWRPAPGCAMNAGGGSPYCPVCLEAGVLAIYERVSPIDRVWPAERSVRVERGAKERAEFRVLPMQPASHALEVRWILGPAPAVTASADADGDDPVEPGDEHLDPFERRLRRLRRLRTAPDPGAQDEPAATPLPTPVGFRLGRARRALGTAALPLPAGTTLKARVRTEKGLGRASSVDVPSDLAPGRYVLTAIVWDATKPKGAKRPWVLKDERGLLEDRCEWFVEVAEPAEPAAPPR